MCYFSIFVYFLMLNLIGKVLNNKHLNLKLMRKVTGLFILNALEVTSSKFIRRLIKVSAEARVQFCS